MLLKPMPLDTFTKRMRDLSRSWILELEQVQGQRFHKEAEEVEVLLPLLESLVEVDLPVSNLEVVSPRERAEVDEVDSGTGTR